MSPAIHRHRLSEMVAVVTLLIDKICLFSPVFRRTKLNITGLSLWLTYHITHNPLPREAELPAGTPGLTPQTGPHKVSEELPPARRLIWCNRPMVDTTTATDINESQPEA